MSAFEISFEQRRLWLHDRLLPQRSAYNLARVAQLNGLLDVDALRQALNEVVRRHQVLRSQFSTDGRGEPVQSIVPELKLTLEVEDLSALPEGRRRREAQQRVQDEAEAPFDLEQGPLVRARLLRLGAQEHWLLLTFHHIVFDDWSMGVLWQEVATLYEDHRVLSTSRMSEMPAQYVDYAQWQRERLQGEVLDSQLAYWKQTLAELAVLDLPTDRVRRVQPSCRGRRFTFALDERLTRSLRTLGHREGATFFTTLLAALQVLLYRYTGQEDVAVGVPVAGRRRPDVKGMIGFFVNTLVLRGDLSGDPTFKDYLGRVRLRTQEAYAHQDIPFEMLVEKLHPKRDATRNPLFQVMLNKWNPAGQVLRLTGLDPAAVVASDTGSTMFDLSFTVVESLGQCKITIEYATDLFDVGTIERLAGHFVTLLEAIIADPEQCIGRLPLLGEAERHQLLVEWNDTAADYPKDRCIHQLFEEQAARTPGAVAVVCEDRQLTYGELNARSNQLAHHLIALGVGPEVLVGICMERSLELIVGLLGILKAGGAYVPLDPNYPQARLAFMLEDTQAPVLLTQQDLLGQLPQYEGCVVCMDRDREMIAAQPDSDPPCPATAENLAYVIYTSGSTGKPKGVAVPHRGVARLLFGVRYAKLDSRQTFLMLSPVSFDASTFELWGALLHGASCVVFPGQAPTMEALSEIIQRHEISTLWLTAALFNAVIDEAPQMLRGVRQLLTGGEALSPSHVRRALALLPSTRLVNGYGPTESTTFACCYEITGHVGEKAASIPIGRPISNTRIYILDFYLQPVPIGVCGELCIGGDGLARGYLNRPELTAEKFVPDRFSDVPGARMYKTGDLVRYLPDGNIEFMGRMDDQVKIRGFRIELGEIEAVLAEHPAVRQAVVLAREDTPGDKRLVAYVVAEKDAPSDLPGQLRAHLRARLPDYMVPAAFVMLDAVPLTPNGKVDRKALPVPERADLPQAAYVAPRTPAEEILAGIWAEVLGLERVGVEDNFFELGGHSLLAVSVIERMRRAGLQADVRALFTTPTIAVLAAAVGGESDLVEVPPNGIPPGCEAITPEMLPLVQLKRGEIERIVAAVPGGAANVQDTYPLGPLQEGILFHHLMAREGDPYLLAALSSFDSRARVDGYVQVLQAVIDRHDILRTAVEWEGLAEPVQVVWRRAPVIVEEVSLDPADGDAARQLRARFDPRSYRLDLRQAPLLRVFIARDAANARWVMLQLFHHLMIDHTTMEVMQQEIQAHLAGKADQLPTPLPFRNFVAQARLGVARGEHEEFFKELIGDVDESTAPFGLAEVQGDGSGISEARRPVDGELARRLRERARALGVSAASVCHVAWAQVLARVSGREDVVFGTVLFGRMQAGEGADRVLGPFINTLPVRIRVDGEGVQASVRHTHTQLARLLRHEHAPLALAQRCSAVAAPAPLFSALLNYRHSASGVQASAGAQQALAGIEYLGSEERTNYPFVLSVDDLGEGFALSAQVQSPIDPTRVCAYMHRALEEIVGALECAPDSPLRSLDVLPEAERHQLLVEWNDTAADYPKDRCIHQLFEEQAARTPGAVAVVCEDRQLTYGELNARSNQLAHHLISLGVGPEALVGICVERSLELIVGLLGILKAGGAYVPLDPGYPQARLAFMLEDTQAPVLLTQQDLLGQWPQYEGCVLCLDRDWTMISAQPDSDPPCRATAGNLAYVIYTSGSTGKPKGVAIEHSSAVTFLRWAAEVFSDQDLAGTLFSTSVCFDLSIFELFAPLNRGGVVIVVENALQLPASPRASLVTLINTVPSAMTELLRMRGVPDSVRTVNLAGESLSETLAACINELKHVDKLYNLYGPTEGTTYSTFAPIARDGTEVPNIGRPIRNTRIYILDHHLNPIPFGVAGELHIGGAGLARGYLNRPELTAERFVPDPFSAVPGARMYKTGDLGRYLPDGNIEFMGRMDDQVKIRGFRIELGEIEAVLAEHPAVRQAVVLAREDTPGDKQLAAYVVAEEDAPADLPGQLREHLRGRLPDYMVPAAFVLRDAVLLTPNGKIDRKALPVPERADLPQAAYVAPRTPAEEILAGIWAEVLGLDKVGVEDSFFELGGHSLLATQVVSRVRQALCVELPLREIFAAPTIAGLAARIEVVRAEYRPGLAAPPLETRVEPGPAQLSFAQQRLWFLHQLMPGNSFYNMSIPWRLCGKLDVGALQASLDALVARHETLRTTFRMEGETALQFIAPPGPVALAVVDLTALPEGGREEQARRLVEKEARRPFDLSTGPLLRAQLLRLSAEDHVLQLTLHHIISDGWSIPVLYRDLGALYHASCAGSKPSLPALSIQYADFSVWQRQWLTGSVLSEQLDYWQGRLGGLTELQLPADRPRPAWPTYAGARESLSLPEELSAGLKSLCQREGATLYMVMLAAFNVLLRRYTGQDDLVVGSPIANRTRSELEDLIGFFVNSLVLRTDTSGDPGFTDLLARVRRVALDAYAHQDLPFERLVEELDPERDSSRNPLFQVMFAVQNAPGHAGTAMSTELTMGGFPIEVTTTRVDLEVHVWEASGQLRVDFIYATDLFDAATMRRMLGHYERVLQGVVANPECRLSALPLLGEAERHQLLVEWNDTAADYPKDRCIHQLFEQQAARTPGAVAVVCEDRQLTYGELDERAERLAARLGEVGVGVNSLVAVYLERSIEIVVALLAVWKAGGAYVPIDPEYPAGRVRFILEDMNSVAVITRESLVGALPSSVAAILQVDVEQGRVAGSPSRSVRCPAQLPEGLAYVIYTSGSTGRPKGVPIMHRSLCNLIYWHQQAYGVTPADRATQIAGPAFDASLWELWPYLTAGASIHIPDDATRLEPGRLVGWLAEQQITLSFLPTPLAEAAMRERWPRDGALRVLLTGGDRLSETPAQELPFRVVNHYGPTENTVVSTCADVQAGKGSSATPPIGRPLPNTRAYVVDSHMQPVPIGVAGELLLGGLQLSVGYWDRPELTAEKFVPDPFSAAPGARMYKTGDLVRYLPDGNIEFLGRIDDQVKIRGFRIELGDIEANLLGHPAVRQAVVLAREDTPGEKRLVAYVVADQGALGEAAQSKQSTGWSAEHVSEWQELYEQTYVQPAGGDAAFNITGWNSSYTGAPIAAEEMREWVDATVERIAARGPRRVLEIGCGTGLLLARLAPACEAYVGTDFSSRALEHVGKLVAARKDLSHVELSQRMADDFAGIAPGSFDTVIINSVTQYLPGIGYLKAVLEGAVAAVSPGGRIFIGDVRNQRLLKAFHASVQCHRAAGATTKEQLGHLVGSDIEHEGELVIDPDFFVALKEQDQRISDVEIFLKRGHYQNELTRFRYDAFVHVAAKDRSSLPEAWLDWRNERLSLADLGGRLAAGPTVLGVRGVPNARLAAASKTLAWQASEEGPETLSGFKEESAPAVDGAIEPEALWSLAGRHGYALELGYSSADSDACMDGLFRKRDSVIPGGIFWGLSTASPTKRWAAYANNPLKAKLVRELTPRLRKQLAEALPDYMVPASFVMLDAVPLTANGKIDRKALPAPERADLPQAAYVAPRTPTEEILAGIWAEVLGLDKVGVEDNFFELGGHSLLATRLMVRIKETLHLEIPLLTIFEAPTIARLSGYLGHDRDDSRHEECVGTDGLLKLYQPYGVGIPLFLVPGLTNEEDFLRYMANLISLLGTAHPLYGFRARGLDGVSPAHGSVQEMAADYIVEMRRVLPDGPYLLLGECVGGIVAYEMARQLHAQRVDVAALVLMDTYCHRPSILWPAVDLWMDARNLFCRWFTRWRDLGKLSQPERLKEIFAAAANAARARVPVGELARQQIHKRAMQAAYRSTILKHHSQRYPGKMTLIVNEEIHRENATLGWEGLVTGGLETHVVPGNHVTRLTKHAAASREVIRLCLERAREQNSVLRMQPGQRTSGRIDLKKHG